MVMFCISMCIKNPEYRRMAVRRSVELGLGLLICPACFWGRYVYMLLLSTAVDVLSIVANPLAYHHLKNDYFGRMHHDLLSFRLAAPYIMALFASGGWQLVVSLVDNSVDMARSPLFLLGERSRSSQPIDGDWRTVSSLHASPAMVIGMSDVCFAFLLMTPEWRSYRCGNQFTRSRNSLTGHAQVSSCCCTLCTTTPGSGATRSWTSPCSARRAPGGFIVGRSKPV